MRAPSELGWNCYRVSFALSRSRGRGAKLGRPASLFLLVDGEVRGRGAVHCKGLVAAQFAVLLLGFVGVYLSLAVGISAVFSVWATYTTLGADTGTEDDPGAPAATQPPPYGDAQSASRQHLRRCLQDPHACPPCTAGRRCMFYEEKGP